MAAFAHAFFVSVGGCPPSLLGRIPYPLYNGSGRDSCRAAATGTAKGPISP